MSPNKIFAVFGASLALLLCRGVGVGQTKSITAQSIIEKMAAQYANASSYQDAGVVEEVKGEGEGRRETVIKFKTFFMRPHFFRFEWTIRRALTPEEKLSVVWNDGKQTYRHYGWQDKGVEKEGDLSLGIAGATGISRGSAHLIPALLMAEVRGFRLTKTSNVSLLGEEDFEGEDCYIVRGYHPHNFPIDMWVSKRDFLLRKVKGLGGVDIRRDIKLNGNIPADLFAGASQPPDKQKQGRVSGVVLDVNDARVAGAKITLARGADVFEALTDDAGGFDVELPAGPYRFTISANGFCKSERDALTITSGATELINTHLEVLVSHSSDACKCTARRRQ